MKIDAVVVTYNRLGKLQECLKSLAKMELKNIHVINNHSNDGTEDYLKELGNEMKNLLVYNLKENLGGAGGFNLGMKKFMTNSDSDFVWIMDDDTIPNRDSLTKLMTEFLKIPKKQRGFAIGQTYWTDGSLTKMNLPVYSPNQSLATNNVRYVDQASFVAIVFPREVIQSIGLPISDFFIWGDDVEYTERIIKKGFKGIQVLNATILHKMAANNRTNIIGENSDKNRIERYFYDFRNRIYLSKQKGMSAYIRTLLGRIVWMIKIIFSKTSHKFLKLKVLLKGTMAGIFFNPLIETVDISGKIERK